LKNKKHLQQTINIIALTVLLFPMAGLSRAEGPLLAPGKLTWIINIHAIQLIEQQGAEAQTLAEAYFNNPNTYITAKPAQIPKIPSRAIPTITFTSYTAFKEALEAGTIDPRYKAVIYDSENWQFTPEEEKKDPGKYYPLFAQLAHAHHLQFLATPATNLVKAIAPGLSGKKFDAFLKLGLPAAVAQGADICEFQAQGAEANEELFLKFVSSAASTAKQANPQVKVLAGLSTNPNGQQVSADELLAVVTRSAGTVDGYWLNIPGQSPYCPKCGEPQPGVAVELLRKMSNERSK
jgi:hypothetical protein